MNLQFSLLVVDDQFDTLDQILRVLEDHLYAKGFGLEVEPVQNMSDSGVQQAAESGGKAYDLVAVDYNLEQEEFSGSQALSSIRNMLPFTEMIFYSSNNAYDLYAELYKEKLSGVFVTNRTDLGDELVGLADTIIAKIVDVNHMRGIAMAEVADMDVLMEKTLLGTLNTAAGDPRVVKFVDRTSRTLREGTEKQRERIDREMDTGNLATIMQDNNIFTAIHRYRAMKRLARSVEADVGDFKSYNVDVLNKRNMLAHVRSPAINEKWMAEFRRDIQKHRLALESLRSAIGQRLGMGEAPHDTEEG